MTPSTPPGAPGMAVPPNKESPVSSTPAVLLSPRRGSLSSCSNTPNQGHRPLTTGFLAGGAAQSCIGAHGSPWILSVQPPCHMASLSPLMDRALNLWEPTLARPACMYICTCSNLLERALSALDLHTSEYISSPQPSTYQPAGPHGNLKTLPGPYPQHISRASVNHLSLTRTRPCVHTDGSHCQLPGNGPGGPHHWS